MLVSDVRFEAQKHWSAEDLDGEQERCRILRLESALGCETAEFWFGRLEDNLEEVVGEEEALDVG